VSSLERLVGAAPVLGVERGRLMAAEVRLDDEPQSDRHGDCRLMNQPSVQPSQAPRQPQSNHRAPALAAPPPVYIDKVAIRSCNRMSSEIANKSPPDRLRRLQLQLEHRLARKTFDSPLERPLACCPSS